jgi:hypothetical protein
MKRKICLTWGDFTFHASRAPSTSRDAIAEWSTVCTAYIPQYEETIVPMFQGIPIDSHIIYHARAGRLGWMGERAALLRRALR